MATRTRTPEIPLDQDLLDLLSSKSRRRILFTLQDRPHTVSELSEELDLSKPTVHEHLDKLEDADLVGRREDERLWVYYHLTDKGEELISPSSSQLRVVVGVAVAALLVGVAAASALSAPAFSLGGGDDGGSPGDRTRFLPDLGNDTVLAQEGASLEVGNLSGLGPDLEAYLVPEESAHRLLSRTPGRIDVVELRVDEAGGDRTLRIPEGTPAGVYKLYVVADGETNVNRMPTVTVEPTTAQVDPPFWWRGLDGAVDVTLPPGSLPQDGQLLLSREGEGGRAASVGLSGGSARIPAGALSDLPAGRYDLRVVADDRSVRLETPLDVRDPGASVAPRHLAPTRSPSVQVGLDDEVPARHVPPPVAVDGDPAPLDRGLGNTWDAPLPTMGGTTQVAVGELDPVPVTGQPPMAWRLEDRGDRWSLALEDADGNPVDGAVVRVDGAAEAVTGEAGEASFDEPSEGEHLLRVEAPSGPVVDQPVAAGATGLRPLAPGADLSVEGVAAGHEHWRVDVTVGVGDATPPGPATVVALDGGRILGAAEVPLGAEAPYRATVPAFPVAENDTTGSFQVELWRPTPPLDPAGNASQAVAGDAYRDQAVVTAGQAEVAPPSPPPWEAADDGAGPWTQLRIEPGEAGAPEAGAGVPAPGAAWALAAAGAAAAARAWRRRR